MPPSTSGRKVARARGAMRRTASSPASRSTPAARYVAEGASAAPSDASPRAGLRRRSRGSDDPPFTTGSGLEESGVRRLLGRHAAAVGAGGAGVAEMRGVGAGGLQHAVE